MRLLAPSRGGPTICTSPVLVALPASPLLGVRWSRPCHRHLTPRARSHALPSCMAAGGAGWVVTGYTPEVVLLGREESSLGTARSGCHCCSLDTGSRARPAQLMLLQPAPAQGSREHQGPRAAVLPARPGTHQERAGGGTDASSNPGSEPLSYKHHHPHSRGQVQGPQWREHFGNRRLPNPVS